MREGKRLKDTPFSSRVLAAINWFVPLDIRNADRLRRARLVVVCDWTLFSLAIVFALIYHSLGSPMCAAALTVGGGIAVACLCAMRRSGSCFVVGNLLAAAFLAVLTVLGWRLGGYGTYPVEWYVAVPVVALSTAGRRSATFWFAATLSLFAAFYALAHTVAPSPMIWIALNTSCSGCRRE